MHSSRRQKEEIENQNEAKMQEDIEQALQSSQKQIEEFERRNSQLEEKQVCCT